MSKNKVQEFLNDNFGEVRCCVDELNNPWFCANDCLKILKYSDNGWSTKISRLNKNGVTKCKVIDSMNREQEANFINEPNLFKLVFGSKMDKAEEFQDWICEVVIPAIRKDGAYINNEEKLSSKEMSEDAFVLEAMTILQNKVKRYKEENEILGAIADRFTNANKLYDIGKFSKILDIKDFGRNKMFEWLREEKYLMADNEPYQHQTDKFKMIYTKKNGKEYSKTLLKSKGISYIVKKLIKQEKLNVDYTDIMNKLNKELKAEDIQAS